MSKLTLVTPQDRYVPNWADPRSRRRVEAVMQWCASFMSETQPRQAAQAALDKIFGHHGHALSTYLRRRLLVRHGGFRPGKFAYNYTLVHGALEALAAEVDPGNPLTVVQLLERRHAEELKTLTFTYKDKADRLWHPLQNVRRDVKAVFWSKYLPHDYDIKACAPTVINHMADKLGMAQVLRADLSSYLDDVGAYRSHVQALTGCDAKTAKRLLNSFFNGARLSRNFHCSAYRVLNNDDDAMLALMQDPKITDLRNAIKRTWKHIERVSQVGKMASKDRWGVYFKMERQMLDAITEHLRQTGNAHFTEHDGFRTAQPIDVAAVEAAVLAKTGVKIEIR